MRVPYAPRVCCVKHVDINLFAHRFERCFDFPRSKKYAKSLIKAGSRITSLESVYNNYGGPPPDSFFHFFKYPLEKVIEDMDGFFESQARLLDLHGSTIAIDTNDVAYWGEKDEYVHRKKGVTKNISVHRYSLCSFVDSRRKLALSCLPVSKKDDGMEIVRSHLEKAKRLLHVRTVLFDRGYYNASILKNTEDMGLEYVIPLRKNQRTDRLWEEAKKTGRTKIPYKLKGDHDHMQTWLYLDKKPIEQDKKEEEDECDDRKTRRVRKRKKWYDPVKEREYIGVLSNKDVPLDKVQEFMNWYYVRNNIETAFKEKNLYRIITSSKDKVYRYLIYCISLYIMNLVQIVRQTNNTYFRNDEMKKLLEILLGQGRPLIGEHWLSRTLKVIA